MHNFVAFDVLSVSCHLVLSAAFKAALQNWRQELFEQDLIQISIPSLKPIEESNRKLSPTSSRTLLPSFSISFYHDRQAHHLRPATGSCSYGCFRSTCNSTYHHLSSSIIAHQPESCRTADLGRQGQYRNYESQGEDRTQPRCSHRYRHRCCCSCSCPFTPTHLLLLWPLLPQVICIGNETQYDQTESFSFQNYSLC